MEPNATTLLMALIAGAAVVTGEIASQAIKDAYTGLKQLAIDKLGGRTDIANALQQVETHPSSKGRQLVLQEEVEKAVTADPTMTQDGKLEIQAQMLLMLLQNQGLTTPAVQITQTGSGGLGWGSNAKVTGKRGVVTDTIHGPVSTGAHGHQVQIDTYSKRQVHTGGGPAVEGKVDIDSGDFVGRDKKV
jgi:hypothetical protein